MLIWPDQSGSLWDSQTQIVTLNISAWIRKIIWESKTFYNQVDSTWFFLTLNIGTRQRVLGTMFHVAHSQVESIWFSCGMEILRLQRWRILLLVQKKFDHSKITSNSLRSVIFGAPFHLWTHLRREVSAREMLMSPKPRTRKVKWRTLRTQTQTLNRLTFKCIRKGNTEDAFYYKYQKSVVSEKNSWSLNRE